jgi:hypothetical protein
LKIITASIHIMKTKEQKCSTEAESRTSEITTSLRKSGTQSIHTLSEAL